MRFGEAVPTRSRIALLHPGYGRIFGAKLLLFTVVMIAATLYGIAQAKNQPGKAKTASITALIGSLGVVLLATALAEDDASRVGS